MKRTKTIISIVLLISMFSGLFAMTASAGDAATPYISDIDENVIAAAEAILGYELDLSEPLVFTLDSTLRDKDFEKIQTFIDNAVASDSSLPGTAEFTISQVKETPDFAGNLYYAIECAPTGYFIYFPKRMSSLNTPCTATRPIWATANICIMPGHWNAMFTKTGNTLTLTPSGL